MNWSLQQLFQTDPLGGVATLVLGFVLFVVLGLSPVIALLYFVHFLLTLPMRRNERARMFLDLLELGLKEGRTPEAAVTDAASSQDPSLGYRFQLLAASCREGRRLTQALERVPRLLPPQIRAMLGAGERIGDVAKVLPACRLLLRDGVSQVRGALNYLLILALLATPFTIVVPILLRIKVFPAFRAVFESSFEGRSLPAFTRVVFAEQSVITFLQIGLFILIWLAVLAYLGGPRLQSWVSLLLPGLPDRLSYRLPWRRKRMQRDFSAMLAVLLDAQVPEPEAVRLAGESTANLVMRRRAEKVRSRLTEGVRLPEAIRAMDDSGELRWRLANALQRSGSFVRALTGWHEALDAKAFQLEQTAAQITTTLFVLANGFIVACIVIGMFLALINLMNQATLW
ncbi:MAG TPA: type II secretion system F family protein [Candidatus Binatia bacterium]|jgi:type II secretory pathway component PulF|nr:type II secretion system F family protein [Candidatus Binatia bacterium]